MNIYDKLQQHAEDNGYIINPIEGVREPTIAELERNKEKYGDYYCPCRSQRVKANVCPCIHHKTEIEENGCCYCELFFKKDAVL